ncbi:MAG: hypothetical protein HGB11_08080 [Chlorobiales bacterium]|jgi:alpha-2-macroglobulin|nr:hypothetical protein [Chlorobiales bacterium]
MSDWHQAAKQHHSLHARIGVQYFDHIELRDDRVTLFATTLSAGVHTYTYFARATCYGQFTMPPTYAEQMYQPEVFGRTRTARITISDLK